MPLADLDKSIYVRTSLSRICRKQFSWPARSPANCRIT